MGVIEAIIKRSNLQGEIGKLGMHIVHPNDFELYICAFELVDYNDNVIKYFSFPILPRQIRISKKNLVNITRTAGGLVDMTDPKFNPVDIIIDGNFGRDFKLVINNVVQKELNTVFSKNRIKFSNIKNTVLSFNDLVKTGYGCCKIIEDIFEESKKMDDGQFRKLYFHNLSFNSLYMVEIENLTFSQSEDSNMIWQYSMKMIGIAPYLSLNSNKNRKKLANRLGATKIVQNILNEYTNDGIGIIAKNVNNIRNKTNVADHDIYSKLNVITNNNKTSEVFDKADEFFKNDYENLFDYFSGKINDITNDAINNLNSLKKSLNDSLTILDLNKDSLNNLEYYYLLERINGIKLSIETLENAAKWSRSSIDKNNFQDSKLSTYTLSQFELLENIFKIDEYQNVSLDNKLLETDFNLLGGQTIKDNIPYSDNQLDFSYLDIVDVINSNTIYGKDIDSSFSFSDDDIATVKEQLSLEQAAQILVKLFKQDNKRNVELGIDKSFIVGTNRSQFSFPVVYRQLLENFSTDSIFKEITILNYEVNQDNVLVDIEITTITNDIFNTKIII